MKKTIRLGGIAMSVCFFLGSATCATADIPIQNSDGEILGVLSAIDQNEIQAAQLAEQKNINHNVINYARALDVDHNTHLDKTRQLSQELGLTIVDNGSLDQLLTEGSEDLAALTALDTDPFAQLYIADMVNGYSEALNWIDMQDTQNEKVKEFLKVTRKYIITNLEKAQKIQEYQQNTY